MKKRIILPIEKNFLTAYPGFGFLSSILPTFDGGVEWMINCLVQIAGMQWRNFGEEKDPTLKIDFYPYNDPFLSESMYNFCPYISNYAITRELMSVNYSSVKDYLIDHINRGYYVWICLNQFFTQGNTYNEKFDFIHPNYIYGYDMNSEEFFVADNFDKGKFGFIRVKFEFIEKAYELVNYTRNFEKHFNRIHLFKRENVYCKFDINLLVNLLYDYINSIDSRFFISQYSQQEYGKISCFMGINCYDYLATFMEQLQVYNHVQCDFRPLCVLKDHKLLMKMRIHYLEEKNYLPNNMKFNETIDEIIHQMQASLNMFIKYSFTRNSMYLEKAIGKLKNVKEREFDLVDKMIRYIK